MTDKNENAGEPVDTAGGGDENPDCGESAAVEQPVKRKKSAAKILKEYYRRRAIMYKEMYENGSTSR